EAVSAWTSPLRMTALRQFASVVTIASVPPKPNAGMTGNKLLPTPANGDATPPGMFHIVREGRGVFSSVSSIWMAATSPDVRLPERLVNAIRLEVLRVAGRSSGEQLLAKKMLSTLRSLRETNA